jgi:hypothetical protein
VGEYKIHRRETQAGGDGRHNPTQHADVHNVLGLGLDFVNVLFQLRRLFVQVVDVLNNGKVLVLPGAERLVELV